MGREVFGGKLESSPLRERLAKLARTFGLLETRLAVFATAVGKYEAFKVDKSSNDIIRLRRKLRLKVQSQLANNQYEIQLISLRVLGEAISLEASMSGQSVCKSRDH